MLTVLGDECYLHPQDARAYPFTLMQASAMLTSCLEWVPMQSRPTPSTCPVPSGALFSSHLTTPKAPQGQKPWRHLSLSYFFLLCVQVIITAPSPQPEFLEVCRPFSLSLSASAKSLSRHASLTTRRPSHSSVSTSGPWKSPPCTPGAQSPNHLLQSLASAACLSSILLSHLFCLPHAYPSPPPPRNYWHLMT